MNKLSKVMRFLFKDKRIENATKGFFHRFETKNIDPSIIAKIELSRLKEIIRKNELYLDTQIKNIRAIDGRALRLMTATGFVISLGLSLFRYFISEDYSELKILNSTISIKEYIWMLVVFAIIGFFSSLPVVASSKILPSGNHGLELMKDLSDGYSEHEEAVDYVFALSEATHVNESLIKQNGRWLFTSSFCLAMNFSLVILMITAIT